MTDIGTIEEEKLPPAAIELLSGLALLARLLARQAARRRKETMPPPSFLTRSPPNH